MISDIKLTIYIYNFLTRLLYLELLVPVFVNIVIYVSG